MEAFAAGTLAGAGSFRCEECGFAVALHERDEVPDCPQCGARLVSLGVHYESRVELRRVAEEGGNLQVADEATS